MVHLPAWFRESGSRHRRLLAASALLLIPALVWIFFAPWRKGTVSVSPRKGPIIEAVYGIGSVTSARVYNLKVGVPGFLEKLHVKEGDAVRRGDPLLVISGLPVFRAPFSGTVTSLPFAVGETLFPQVPLLTLMDTSDLYLLVILEQEGALRVRRGQKARFKFESLRGTVFEGTVRTLYPSSGQFKVIIDVDRLPGVILPGMTADVAVEVDRKEGALLIPLSSLFSGTVTLIRDGKRKKIPVEVGSVDGEWAEVIRGDVRMSDEILLRASGAKSGGKEGQ